MAFFTQELAIDLGTANTVIFKGGEVVLDEPSIIAPPRIYTVRPLMNGVIADYDAAEKMLTGFIKKAAPC